MHIPAHGWRRPPQCNHGSPKNASGAGRSPSGCRRRQNGRAGGQLPSQGTAQRDCHRTRRTSGTHSRRRQRAGINKQLEEATVRYECKGKVRAWRCWCGCLTSARLCLATMEAPLERVDPLMVGAYKGEASTEELSGISTATGYMLNARHLRDHKEEKK